MPSNLRRTWSRAARTLNFIIILAPAALAGPGAQIEPHILPDNRGVAVCMDIGGPLWIDAKPAQAQASKIFSKIGISIEWHDDHRSCPAAEHPIRITFVMNTPASELPGALACSWPFEGIHVRIFYDRARRATGSGNLPSLLGHVLAHEIAHVLEGTNRHSATGVMKAHWTAEDCTQMARKPLSFEEADQLLIYNGMAMRGMRSIGVIPAT